MRGDMLVNDVSAEPGLAYRFVGAESAEVVRELMRAAFGEYAGVLAVPSSAMDETVDDTAAHIALGGAVVVSAGDEAIASGRFEWRDDHVYIGRLSTLPAWRGKGIASAMMTMIEGLAFERGYGEARISVRTMLPKNIELYERLGYVVTRRYKHDRGEETVVDMAERLVGGWHRRDYGVRHSCLSKP